MGPSRTFNHRIERSVLACTVTDFGLSHGGTTAPGRPISPAGERLGRYTLERSIGRGAFGEVFLARHEGPGGFSRRVAIKVLLPEAALADKGLEAFHREGRTAALLSHRNIIQVLDVGQEKDRHYLVMEHVDGVNLLELGHRVGRALPTWVGVGIILEVARGLAHAHALRLDRCPRGVVHRDVKPSNILLGAAGDVKLSDFGLAKRLQLEGDQLTVAGMVKGTPGFMSPEQMQGEESGAPSDIHALGAVLLWLLTGRMPSVRLEKSVLDDLPEGAIPPTLEPFIEAAMCPVPERRPDAETLVRRLGEELARLAPPGAVPHLAETIGRWVAHTREGLRGAAQLHGSRTLTQEDGAPFVPAVHAMTPYTASAPTRSRRFNWRWGVVVAVVAALGVLAGLVASGDLVGGGSSDDTAHLMTTGDALPDAGAPSQASMETPRPDAEVPPDHAHPDLGAPDIGSVLQQPPRRRLRRRQPRRRQPQRSKPLQRSKPQPPPAAKPRGRGFLSVDSDPWSYVHVDGRRLGMTPLWRAAVSAGPHRLELKASRGSHRRQIDIAPNGHLNLGRISLR